MCDPILVTLFKMLSHHSQSSCENATPSSGTSPLASYKEVLPRDFNNLSNDTLLLLPYSQHWNRASVFWGRKHRTEGDIQVRVKAYWIWRALWLAWLGNELYRRSICSLARLGKRVWNRTAWARRFIRDYWIEVGFTMKKPNTNHLQLWTSPS